MEDEMFTNFTRSFQIPNPEGASIRSFWCFVTEFPWVSNLTWQFMVLRDQLQEELTVVGPNGV